MRQTHRNISRPADNQISTRLLKTNRNALIISISALSLLTLLWVTQAHAVSPSSIQASAIKNALYKEGLYANKALKKEQFIAAMVMYERAEYYLARRLLLPLAQKQHTEAEFYMGMINDMGLGVTRSPEAAVHWYQRAARKGYHHAQHNLAVAYAHGEGVQQDISEALQWWERAARQGNTDSQYNLGIVYATGNQQVKRDLLEAEKWWRKAAINGDAMAQYNLGALYANGEKKVTSYCEAIRWWQESARSGMEQAKTAIEILKQRDDYQPC